MSENNKNVDFNDEKEPIDSIEQTVEDLKKKIAELSEEKELEAENNNEAADERMQKIQEIKDATVNTLKIQFQILKKKHRTYQQIQMCRRQLHISRKMQSRRLILPK